jgi:2-keto-4-pentenoate hydratase
VTGLDSRVAAGMREQLRLRDRLVSDGARQIGWKMGFGSAAGLASLGIARPLVGFLLDSGLLPDGSTVPIRSWQRPVLEPEVAVRVRRDVPVDATWDETRASIDGLAPAIELVDINPPPEQVGPVLAGNIFHRHLVLGPVDDSRSTGDGLSARLLVDGVEVSSTDDPATLTGGDVVELVRQAAELLGACGEVLAAGQVVITGSVLPPLPMTPGQRVEAHIDPLGSLSVTVG